MSQPLPPEIRVAALPAGTRYVLPWRPVPPEYRRGIRIGVVVAVLAWAAGVYLFLQPTPPTQGKGGSRSPLVLFCLAGGLAGLAFAAIHRFSYCSAEVGPDKLVLSEWRGPFPYRRERALDRIRAVVFHPLPGATQDAGAIASTAGGVVEVVCEGIQPMWWAHGYAQGLLAPLAKELARQCRVPHRAAGPSEEPPPAVPPFAEQGVLDTDSADVTEKPFGSRLVVHRSSDRWTLTLPPVLGQGKDRAGMVRMVDRFWMLIPVVAGLLRIAMVFQPGHLSGGYWFFVVGVLIVGPILILALEQNMAAQTTFKVRGGRLTRLKTSPVFACERLSWRREDIFALRTVTTKGGKGPDKAAVTLFPAAGQPIKLIENTTLPEMGWVATALRQELGVPAFPGSPTLPATPMQPAMLPALPSGPRLPLPASVRVQTMATGTRFVLPWLRPPRRVRMSAGIALLLGLAALGAGVCLWTGYGLPDWVRGARVACGLGAFVLVGFGGLLAVSAAGLLVQRSAVEVGPGELRVRWRTGLLSSDRSWPIANIRNLVTRRLFVEPGVAEAEAPGLIEVVGEGATSFRFGLWYPVGLLQPLAQELAQRLNVPEEPGDALAKPPPLLPGDGTTRSDDEEIPEEETADKGKQPAESRALLERGDGEVTITLPPPGCRYDRPARVVRPFAVAAGTFAALNGLAVLSLAVDRAASPEEVAGLTECLLVSTAVAALLGVWVVRRAGCRTILRASANGLTVVRSGLLRLPRRQEWPRDQVAAVRLGPAVPQPYGGKGLALRLILRDGRSLNILTGDDEVELRWLATVLRQALGVTAVPR
jgi:hypothetical protein